MRERKRKIVQKRNKERREEGQPGAQREKFERRAQLRLVGNFALMLSIFWLPLNMIGFATSIEKQERCLEWCVEL